MEKYYFRLFIIKNMPASERAYRNFLNTCESELKGLYRLEVIDVLENPQLAEDEQIVATPTLIKQSPPPVCRVLGDFYNKERVLKGLDILIGKREGNKEKNNFN